MTGLESSVRVYVAQAIARCEGDRILSVERFAAGDRHAVYKVAYHDESLVLRHVVVRVSTRRGPEACREAERESTVLRVARPVGAPTVYDMRCESRWFDSPVVCMQFISGEQRDLTALNVQGLGLLGALLARVHRLPVDEMEIMGAPADSLVAYLDDRCDAIRAQVESILPALPTPLRERINAASAFVDSRLTASRDDFLFERALVLLHGDPGLSNVIWTPLPVLVDWEYARLGDPADEIAYLFSQLGLSDQQRFAFWQGYREVNFDQADDSIGERVHTWEPLTLLGSMSWWLQLAVRRALADERGANDPAAPRPANYYFENAGERLRRLETLSSTSP